MAARTFTVNRRVPNILDVLMYRTGADQYRLKWTTNFDVLPAAYVTITTAPPGGWKDPAVDYRKLGVLNIGERYSRIVFDPATFSIPDNQAFWMIGVPVTGGVEGTPSAPALVLPFSTFAGKLPVVIAGTAPNAATVAGSQQIDFPSALYTLTLRNNGAASIFIATDANGPEFELPTAEQLDIWLVAGAPSIWVRGDGATVDFSAILTQSV